MKTIKIIDLLIRCLEKDETLPKEIKFKNIYYFLSQHADVYAYYRKTDRSYNFMEDIFLISTLNKEIEIIEEEKKSEVKEIQKIKSKRFSRNQKQIAGKINELIDAVNEIRRGN